MASSTSLLLLTVLACFLGLSAAANNSVKGKVEGQATWWKGMKYTDGTDITKTLTLTPVKFVAAPSPSNAVMLWKATDGVKTQTFVWKAKLSKATSSRKLLADCPILNLDLAPLDLNLLGLRVLLDEVNLDIIAQSGAGELLGNLLCAVVGLLDGSGLLSNLLGSLNDLLAQLLSSISL